MNRTCKLLGSLLVALMAACAATAQADVKLPKIFGAHMVIQQETDAPVWGWAEPGEAVKVTLGSATAETKAGDNGKWMVRIKTPKANGEPLTLRVAGKNVIEIADVLAGEVWVCSGQSNMQWTIPQSANPQEEIKNANHPQIRMITLAREGNVPQAKPVDDLMDVKNPKCHIWLECKSDNTSEYSAVAYYFGRKLQSELKVPVGLINTSWGGTICEAWTSKEKLASDKEWLGPLLERDATFRPGNPNQCSALFNSMIHPLIPFAIKGAIWYQGESNRDRAEQYQKLFPAMISDWREKWGQGDFPFLFVQLAPYCYAGDAKTKTPKDSRTLPELWEAQFKTLALPNTGMAVTTDITELFDIHPKNKQDVGARLALWALANFYGQKDLIYSGPLYESMAVEGGKIRIKFKHAAGLQAKDGQALTFFTIAGDDGKFVDATATIEGETVVVSSPDVPKPAAVRFGWKDYATPNLFNKAGLPASPFRTDSLPNVTAGKLR